jgi:dihydrofolate reductase
MLATMGRVIHSMSVSLDSFVETTGRSLDWVQVDEELHSFFNDEAREASAFLYGRRMYELMTDYWPTGESDPSATPAMVEFARIWKDKPKIVFSRTLDSVDWNSRLVHDDPAEEVARLKAQPGFDMSVGGPTLASTLMRHGLIDEFRADALDADRGSHSIGGIRSREDAHAQPTHQRRGGTQLRRGVGA